ncbi:OLC1v1016989C1 [Oldenlandia corymbosa var. corymbosa]|uniref:Voltage-dependent anion-selective channel protein n=1 Tax=Oldenlandia corymbosa var. corymbosa TaxID=529605 RepID=A0AAV1E8E9_OLDCO|nr:OLC1v1016989C1 [Oldenlandia corymbosa var. corymbosa]
MSPKGPGLFSGFGHKARDILYKDYSTEHKVSVSTDTSNGVGLTSTVLKKNGLSGGEVTCRYKHKNATLDTKVDMDSRIASTMTVVDILPSTRAIATLKFPEYDAGKVEAQYLHEHASFTASCDLNKSPSVNVSATIGTPLIAFGTEASYATRSQVLTKYNAGVRLTKPNYGVSAILADKGDTIKASCFCHPDQLKRGTIAGEMSRKLSSKENTLTMGGSYALDSQTLVKATLNNHGHLGALVQHELSPKSFLIISGSFDALAMDKTPRLGMAVSLRP